MIKCGGINNFYPFKKLFIIELQFQYYFIKLFDPFLKLRDAETCPFFAFFSRHYCLFFKFGLATQDKRWTSFLLHLGEKRSVFSNFSCIFLNPNNFSNNNYNCSNLLDMRKLQKEVKKAFCYQKLLLPFLEWSQKCWKISPISLEFQKCFLITWTFFFTVD